MLQKHEYERSHIKIIILIFLHVSEIGKDTAHDVRLVTEWDGFSKGVPEITTCKYV